LNSRSLKKGWVDAEGNVQAAAFQPRREHPVTHKPEDGLSVGLYGSAQEFYTAFGRRNEGVGSLRTDEIENVQCDPQLYVEQTSETHANIMEVPFWDTPEDAGYLIASDLADLTNSDILPPQTGNRANWLASD
jgi:hypothetical protein